MNKQELFEKYSVDGTHMHWDDNVDNWLALDLFMVMHKGNLPQPEDNQTLYILDFIDMVDSGVDFDNLQLCDLGSLYVTAKRLVYKLSENILDELNT